MPTTPSGLQYEDNVVGDGAEAKAGHHVHVPVSYTHLTLPTIYSV